MAHNIIMADDTTPPNDDKPGQASEELLNAADAQNAVDLIRDKVKRLYNNEPDAKRELAWTPSYASWRDGFRAELGG